MNQLTMSAARRARHFLRTLVTTENDEPDCDGVDVVLPRYVDQEVSGGESDGLAAGLAAGLEVHFDHCPGCADVHAALRHVAGLEANGCMPALEELWSTLRGGTRPPMRR